MSPNPLIIAKGAKALGAATAGAAKGAAAQIALSEKAAKGVSSAFKSIEETTKMQGWQQLENFSENIKQLGPVASAFEVLGAQFTAGTMTSQVNLMKSLLVLFESPAGQAGMSLFISVVNAFINSLGKIIDVVTDATETVDNWLDSLVEASERLRREVVAELWVDPGRDTTGAQEFD